MSTVYHYPETSTVFMAAPWAIDQPRDVVDKVLRRAEVARVSLSFMIGTRARLSH